METLTPETDAIVSTFTVADDAMIPVAFSRKLKRERDELKAGWKRGVFTRSLGAPTP